MIDAIIIIILLSAASAPQGLLAAIPDDAAGRTSIILMWQRPASPNRVITHYEVNVDLFREFLPHLHFGYMQVSYNGIKDYDVDFFENQTVNTPVEDESDNSQVTRIVNNLTPSTKYVFTVAAYNGAGRGNDSNTTTSQTLVGGHSPTSTMS